MYDCDGRAQRMDADLGDLKVIQQDVPRVGLQSEESAQKCLSGCDVTAQNAHLYWEIVAWIIWP